MTRAVAQTHPTKKGAVTAKPKTNPHLARLAKRRKMVHATDILLNSGIPFDSDK